jgi:hypothetical protein
MLRDHYWEVVTKEDAERYFAITASRENPQLI